MCTVATLSDVAKACALMDLSLPDNCDDRGLACDLLSSGLSLSLLNSSDRVPSHCLGTLCAHWNVSKGALTREATSIWLCRADVSSKVHAHVQSPSCAKYRIDNCVNTNIRAYEIKHC